MFFISLRYETPPALGMKIYERSSNHISHAYVVTFNTIQESVC